MIDSVNWALVPVVPRVLGSGHVVWVRGVVRVRRIGARDLVVSVVGVSPVIVSWWHRLWLW